MASPLKSTKATVDTSSRAPGSRIRREPPPAAPVKKLDIRDIDDRDRRLAIIGIISFALAMFAIIIGFAAMGGWTPSQYVARF